MTNASSSSAPGLSQGSENAKDSSVEEVDRLLGLEATAFQRDLEVERILKAFKLNPYNVLGLQYHATEADIKKKYKQLSLFIHPDKAKHEKAPDAFDLLKKAESELSDKDKRAEIDSVVAYARTQVLKSHGIPSSVEDSDYRIQTLLPPFVEQLGLKVKELLIDDELRKRRALKMSLANEGLEAKRKEEEVAAKKRKADEDANWEANRDKRVEGWRSFQSTGPSKKKKKNKVEIIG
ncbi:uncharacterized protein EI90DRAFT_3012399 [Cantharellus anzutake]|uniref:uncharacterized protein n=1 Tax=Cantharellus anzutake TaxID=1750568 RepID=UPI001903B492|nr:uncharacterized protein EI90DRAFT_3012399 [Cantharellus anzutake]KAF8340571.1 hypothetical protein EI90DRAFT_3012399 [Cantharellus anzutake]